MSQLAEPAGLLGEIAPLGRAQPGVAAGTGATLVAAAAGLREPRSPPLLAIVVPCFNERETIAATVARLSELLDDMERRELIRAGSFLYVVDDGSSDGTWMLLAAAHGACGANGRLRVLRLSRNFGHQNALLAGLLAVRGRCDAAVSIDADLQQDPLALPKFVAEHAAGADIIFGVRNDRAADTWLKRSTAQAFYSLLRLMGVDIVRNHADYRLLSARALAVLAEHSEPNPFLRAICAQLGFRTAVVHFDVGERHAGVSKYSLLKMLKLAIEGITSFSVVPLRAVSVLGMLVFAVSAVMGCYVLARALIVGDTVPGWASTTLPIYFLGGVQILSIGIVGEYVAQITVAVKKRPRYVVETELF